MRRREVGTAAPAAAPAAASFDERLLFASRAAAHSHAACAALAGLTRKPCRTLRRLPLTLQSVAADVNSMGRHRRPGQALLGAGGTLGCQARLAEKCWQARLVPGLFGRWGRAGGQPTATYAPNFGHSWTNVDYYLVHLARCRIWTLPIKSCNPSQPSGSTSALPHTADACWAAGVQKWRALQGPRVAERQPWRRSSQVRTISCSAAAWTAVAATPSLSTPSASAAAAGPSGTDFTNVGVQDMMKLYYCELRRCPWWPLVCRSLPPPQPAVLTPAGLPTRTLPAAARLFPHQEMYKWLAYGNGEPPGRRCLCCRWGPLPQQGGLRPPPLPRGSPAACAPTHPPWLAGWPRAG